MNDFQIDGFDDIRVVKVNILIATHRDAKTLWNELESKSIFEYKKIIIDISFCNHVDSTFLGMIVKIFRKVCLEDGRMNLVLPNINLIESFRLMGVTKIIPCHKSIQDALDGIESDRLLQ